MNQTFVSQAFTFTRLTN